MKSRNCYSSRKRDGLASATAFAKEGSVVIVSNVSEEARKRLTEELGSKANFIACNVADEEM